MRVLHLATTYPLFVGDSNAAFVEVIAEGLAARGHEISVLVPAHPRLVLGRLESRVRLRTFAYSPLQSWHPWGYAQGLRADRQLRWDAYLAAVPAAISSIVGLRRWLAREPIDLLHAHWLLPNAPLVAAAGGGRSVPMVISCHGSGVYLAERHRWAKVLAMRALRAAAAVTVCSGDLRSRVGALGASAVHVVPYGVNIDQFRPLSPEHRAEARSAIAARHDIPPAAPWILAVGRLVYKKGFDRLIAARKRMQAEMPEAQLLIVGQGPLETDLRARAERAGLQSSINFLGAVAHTELPSYYAAADVVAVPSVHDRDGNVDGLPNTLLEALASGAAVVASRVAGIPDVVEDGVNGVLSTEGDIERLALEICDLLANRHRMEVLGTAARAHAELQLGCERVATTFEAIYEAALG